MGASGVQLFDDDLAADVRDLFREQLKRGESGSKATTYLIDKCLDIIGTEEESVFWLALAHMQWEYGLLQHHILEKAITIIDNELDLQRWADTPELREKRKRVLERLHHKLTSPNHKPKAVPLRKRIKPKCEWDQGDIVAYKIDSNHFILLRIIDVMDNAGDDLPVCELLDWMGTKIPDITEVKKFPIRRNKRYPSESMFYMSMLKKHLSRCQSLGIQTPTIMNNDGSYINPINFNNLREELEEFFGMFSEYSGESN